MQLTSQTATCALAVALLFGCGTLGSTRRSQVAGLVRPAPTVTAGTFTTSLATQPILDSAAVYLAQAPVPITQFRSPRSAGGAHDFYSEGDYWWPDPVSPDSPYVRRDGLTNPENFNAHRNAMRDLARWVATLTAAYELTGERRYVEHAMRHLVAFFVTTDTRMAPHLLYGQAIQGRFTGRGIGIIDTIHLIEVCRALKRLRALGYLDEDGLAPYRRWFGDYVTWMTTHPYGIDERDHGNNHSTWWAAQVAAFAKTAQRDDLLDVARERFRTLLAAQMDVRGGFTDELARTKPYSYSLFNLEGFSVLAELASTPTDDLWRYEGKTGSLRKAWNFMVPALRDKSTWTFAPDVQHFDELPVQQVGLLLSAVAYDDADLLRLWANLPNVRPSEEVDRTYPLRQAVMWVK